jgi:N-acetylglucosamine-6-phosphate deacetylase
VIAPGLRADLVHLDDDHRVTRTWIGGVLQEVGE